MEPDQFVQVPALLREIAEARQNHPNGLAVSPSIRIQREKLMQTFMVEISLSGLTPEKVKALMPEEDRIVEELQAAGVVSALYVRADLMGAYLVGQAADSEALRLHLARLPMYPHMALKFVSVIMV